jgi:hypothetical protein
MMLFKSALVWLQGARASLEGVGARLLESHDEPGLQRRVLEKAMIVGSLVITTIKLLRVITEYEEYLTIAIVNTGLVFLVLVLSSLRHMLADTFDNTIIPLLNYSISLFLLVLVITSVHIARSNGAPLLLQVVEAAFSTAVIARLIRQRITKLLLILAEAVYLAVVLALDIYERLEFCVLGGCLLLYLYLENYEPVAELPSFVPDDQEPEEFTANRSLRSQKIRGKKTLTGLSDASRASFDKHLFRLVYEVRNLGLILLSDKGEVLHYNRFLAEKFNLEESHSRADFVARLQQLRRTIYDKEQETCFLLEVKSLLFKISKEGIDMGAVFDHSYVFQSRSKFGVEISMAVIGERFFLWAIFTPRDKLHQTQRSMIQSRASRTLTSVQHEQSRCIIPAQVAYNLLALTLDPVTRWESLALHCTLSRFMEVARQDASLHEKMVPFVFSEYV